MKTITHQALMVTLDTEDLVSDRLVEWQGQFIFHEVIFKFEGNFYRTNYLSSAGGNQPKGGEHDCTRVFPFDITVQSYKDDCTRLKDLQDGEWFRHEGNLYRRLGPTTSHAFLCYDDSKNRTNCFTDQLVVTLVKVAVGEIL